MESRDALSALAALAHDNRLAIFRHLVEAGLEGCAAGRIAAALALPSATLSFHLKDLRHAGLVNVRRDGRSLIYSANFGAMNDLILFLTRNCCGGDATACGLPAVAARREEPA